MDKLTLRRLALGQNSRRLGQVVPGRTGVTCSAEMRACSRIRVMISTGSWSNVVNALSMRERGLVQKRLGALENDVFGRLGVREYRELQDEEVLDGAVILLSVWGFA